MQVAVQTRARNARTSADSKLRDRGFRRYGPETSRQVRAPDVKPRDLRKRREMLRAMTPEQALAVIEFYTSLTFFQAFELAKRTGRIIVPNDVHDRILVKVDEEQIRRVYLACVITGNIIVYGKPDKPFGKFVEFDGLIFAVPKNYQGKRNCALVIDHPDFDLVGHELVVPDPANIQLVKNFPKKGGWYLPHAETITPHGVKVADLDKSRCLWRDEGSYIGPVARVCVYVGDGRRIVNLNGSWSFGSGVALF